MKLDAHTDPAIFRALSAEWTRLLATWPRDTIFATPEWAETWWRAFGEGRDLLALTLREGDDLVGIVPLFVEHEGERRLLRFLGGIDVTDYEDILARPGMELAVWDEALAYISKQAWDLDLHNIPGTSPTIDYFRKLGEKGGYRVTLDVEDVCPVIDPLPPDWDSYLDGLNKRDRHELRRKQRRLLGDTDTGAEITWHAADLPQAMKDFVRLHKLSSADKAEFMTPRMVGFFNSLAQMCQEHGWLCLAFLSVMGVRVSTIMAFEYGDGFYLYNSGYDPAYEHMSSGLMLKALAVEYAIKSGKKCYDFLQGSETYKYDLGGKDTQVYQISCVKA